MNGVIRPINGLRSILITCFQSSRPKFPPQDPRGRDAAEARPGLTWLAAAGPPLKAAQQARGRFAWGVWLLSRAEVRASSALGSSRRGLGDKGARSRRAEFTQARPARQGRAPGGGRPEAGCWLESRRQRGRKAGAERAGAGPALAPPFPAGSPDPRAPQPEQRPRLSRGQWRLLPRLRPGRAAGSAGSWSSRRLPGLPRLAPPYLGGVRTILAAAWKPAAGWTLLSRPQATLLHRRLPLQKGLDKKPNSRYPSLRSPTAENVRARSQVSFQRPGFMGAWITSDASSGRTSTPVLLSAPVTQPKQRRPSAKVPWPKGWETHSAP
ncbi:PREDICTED: uncharacterized protein LOC105524982 [Colobus angolensis palliatus]|uniref:uncharacterized protein LOC105524982 n=1 Tax=Colobus angolensis palliatus TaxID=336983 RepID=UPI0005F4E3E7|nr:PREDICTED: uncharacterized protein LOC105524982 [Colobus angolensis palliatus]